MKTEKIEIRISPAEKELLREVASKQDISMSQLIRQLIKEYIKENTNE